MNLNEGARRAQLSDRDAVVGLARQGIDELVPHRGGGIWHRREAHPEPLETSVGTLVEDDGEDHLVVVGTVDDVVVAYAIVAIDTLHDGDRLAVVSDLYVDPEARGVGLGEAMMDLLIAWAREAGAVGIDALALPGDRATKNFFETAGLTARAILVHRSFATVLPDAETPTP